MTLFLSVSLVLLAVFVFLIFRIWSRKSLSPHLQDPEWQALLIKRDEIEHDQTISESTRETLRAEWAATADQVLAASQASSTQANSHVSKAKPMPHAWLAYLSCGVVLLALFTYMSIGTLDPLALQQPHLAQSDANPMEVSAEPPPPDGAKHPGDNETLEQRIAQLEKKLKETPDDVDRWVLLARSRGVQRDFAGEADALKQALRLSPGHPDLMADLADTLAMINNKSLTGEPSELIAQVLKADPQHRKGLALAATEAMQNRDKKTAVEYWRRLRATFPANAPDLARIDEILAEIGAPVMSGADPVAATPSSTNPVTASIEGDVVLDSKLVAELRKNPAAQNAMLYVFAKMVSGPPMPLAVMRISPQDLLAGKKIPFKLDDSLAMSPAMKLSGSSQVNLEARLSMSGNAIKQAGDFGVVMPAVKVGTQGLHLVIQSPVTP
ncbi:MAG: tetratricopeptide repeat protein [Methylophilaceae bacterium]